MKYRNVATVYDGYVDGLPKAPQVYPTAKYQAQHDSIMEGNVALPEYRKPAPTRQQVRRMLMQNAKSQMFAAIEDLQEQSRAIADFVKMTEEHAYQDAMASWEKERDAHNERYLAQWREYAVSMKPLLENDVAVVEKKLAGMLGMLELPVGFDVSYEVDADGVWLEVDGAGMDAELIPVLCEHLVRSAAGVAIAAELFHVEATCDGDVVYARDFARTDLIDK